MASTTAATGVTGNSLGLQDLLKIMLTQLTFQDPLKPMDNQQFVAQIAQFSALDASQQTNSKIDQLLALQATTQSVGLLSHTVDVNNGGTTATGTVSAIDLSTGTPQMTITLTGGQTLTGITLSQVTNIR